MSTVAAPETPRFGVIDSADWLLSLSCSDPAVDRAGRFLSFASRGPLWASLHGTLYDTSALSNALGCAAEPEAAPVDLVLTAFERWGFDAVRRFRGVFVVALGDAARREVIVARDPLGSHPLFFSRTGDRVLVAESARCLRHEPGVSGALNRAALADHLCHRWPLPTETFFAAIERVPPGSWLRLSVGTVGTSRYWDPAPPGEPIRWTTADDVARFPDLLDRAVDRCIGSGQAAVFLSGGLDSISVAAVASDRARHLGRPAPWALSLAMPDPECDERATQTAAAATLGMPQHLVDFDEAVGSRGLLLAATDLGRDLSSPLLNVWGPAYMALAARGAASGVTTVLSGSGGDEWLSVSPYLSADLMASGDVLGLWRFMRAFRRSYRHPFLRHLQLAAWTFGARPLASRALSRITPGPWGRRRHSRMIRRDPPWVAADPQLRRAQLDRSSQALEAVDPAHGFYLREVRTGLEHALTSWELEEQYEFGRRGGLRFLHPYWDPDLVDMLYRTPPGVLSMDGRAKSLVRETLARRFPQLRLDRQRKVSGTGFYKSLVGRHGRAATEAVGDCRALAELGVITTRAAREYAASDFGNLTNRWDLLNLETWVRANTP